MVDRKETVMMQVKKDVIRKRFEAQLKRIAQHRIDREKSFPGHKKKYIKGLQEEVIRRRPARNWKEWHSIPSADRPREPYFYDEYALADRERRVKRNMEILEAIEGDMIDVVVVKTSTGLTLETMFTDVI